MADLFCHTMLLIFLFFVGVADLVASKKAEPLQPALDFSRHTLVKPRIYHGRENKQISTTKKKHGKHHLPHLTIKLFLHGKDFILDMHLNKDIILDGYFHRYQQNGSTVVHKPNFEDADLCHYKGNIRDVKKSWAALSTCHKGISGVIYDGEEMFYIERGCDNHHGHINGFHYIYKHSDLRENNKTCGNNGDHNYKENEFNRISRYKRALEDTNVVKGPYNANKQSRYVELILVIDNREYKELGESYKKIDLHCKEIVNIVNSLYAPLNIFIALVGIDIWSEYDLIDFLPSGDTTLTNFLHYRRETLLKEHPNDNAQLLTKFSFENGVVGKALKGPICTIEYSGGVSTDHSPVIGLVATTVAHEMGHNFGMEHDTNDCVCPEDRCIMAPSSSSVPPIHWSSCSLEYLALAFEHGMDYCLRNKPVALYGSPVCGNGFVEPGEQCDCGLPELCDNTCCNATTCMLYNNATCATGECCDLNTCRPKSAGTLCRSADFECDLPEYCTGQSEYCPKDIYKLDTESCDHGKAYCYRGFCRTRTDQCKLLWGDTGRSSDEQCYKMNTRGSRHGNCGYNKLNQSYHKCGDTDVLCGMLHCKHLNERLEFGMESVAILSHSFINVKGTVIPCRTALVDLGVNQIDPGLAPNGAKCGNEKMCINQKCMSIESFRKSIPTCSNDCNGNGRCNSLGHCHCNDGFAPPFCDYPGPGGSEDSGPASDPSGQKTFVTFMFIIFLGIIPVIAIIGFVSYYTKHNLKLLWKRSAVMKKPPSKPRGMPPFHAPQEAKQTEDNHSLLQNDASRSFQNDFFGHFKGFSVIPVKKQDTEVIRPAPPVPIVPSGQRAPPTTPMVSASMTIKSPKLKRSKTESGMKDDNFTKPILRSHLNVKQANSISVVSTIHNAATAPALPPLNPGAHPRPIISSPILENSTCTAKELVSPLKNATVKAPLRVAPVVPSLSSNVNMIPLSISDAISNLNEEEKIIKDSTLNRIASFLKSTDKCLFQNVGSLPRKQHSEMKQKKVLDKSTLRKIEISNPIPQTDIPLSKSILPVDGEERKVVMRAQSMRGDSVTRRPNIPNFGSMRQTHTIKRPMSIPSGIRPKSPPPPRPNSPKILQNDEVVRTANTSKLSEVNCTSNIGQNQYDDCLNQVTSSKSEDAVVNDNIYAVIDESTTKELIPEDESNKNNASNESVGLLGEIVSEIQNRNLDSIYSTSTLSRMKKQKDQEKKVRYEDQKMDPLETYVNTASFSKVPDSIYSNMNKSSASSTSSGYINPSSVNFPIKSYVESETKEGQSNEDERKNVKYDIKKPPISGSKPCSSAINTNCNQTNNSSIKNSDKRKQDSCNPIPTVSQKLQRPTATSCKDTVNSSFLKNGNSKSEQLNVELRTTAVTTKPSERQSTQYTLKSRIPSPTRNGQTTPKTATKYLNNSPDLVASCSANIRVENNVNPKSPDVLNGDTLTVKEPTISNSPKISTKLKKSVSVKFTSEKKPKISESKPSVGIKTEKYNPDAGVRGKSVQISAKNIVKQSSTVASMQQKFEKKSIAAVKIV